jgi:DNA-binding transcriptional LysR family regulator
MDRLLSMRTFQKVIDEGGFAAAARALHTSPAGVTRLVTDLEQHLGTRLIQRTTRKLALTDAGEAYLLRVRGILSEVDDAEAAAAQSSSEMRGTVHVLAPPLFASYFLAFRVREWLALHPKVALNIVVDPFPQTRVEEFDVTFMIVNEGFDANVVARPIGHTDWVVSASPAYLAAQGTPAAPQDLAGQRYLRFAWQAAAGHGTQSLRLVRADGSGAPVEVPMSMVLQSVSYDILFRAAADGAGIAVLPRALASDYFAQGALVHLLPDWIFGRYTVYAALPTRKLVPARTRAFVEFIAQLSMPPAR